MRRRSRSASALVIVLAITLLLASQIYILHVFSAGSFRHIDRLNAHVRAIYVGESAFSRVLARLKGASWAERWFRDAAAVENDVPLGAGSYSSYVSAVPDPDEKLTDVWIEARYGGSVAVMYWRVLYVDGTLDFTAQVYPRFFTFLPDDAPQPAPGSPTKNILDNMLAQQEGNRRKAMDVLAVLEGERTLAGVAGVIGMPFDDRVNDRTSPFQGEGVPQAEYLAAVQGELAVGGLPDAPAEPSPGPLVEMFPTPSDVVGLMKNVFSRNGLPDPDSLVTFVPPDRWLPDPGAPPELTRLFKNSQQAAQKWGEAKQVLSQGKEWKDFAKLVLDDFVKELADGYGETGNETSFGLMMDLKDYLKQVTDDRIAAGFGKQDQVNRGLERDKTEPSPLDKDKLAECFKKYLEWWEKPARDGGGLGR